MSAPRKSPADYSAEPLSAEVPAELAGLRFDLALARMFPNHSRSRLQSWMKGGRITMDGKVTEFPITSHDSQPRAMTTHPDGSIWFVQTSTNSLGRIDRDGAITEHKVMTVPMDRSIPPVIMTNVEGRLLNGGIAMRQVGAVIQVDFKLSDGGRSGRSASGTLQVRIEKTRE